MDEALAILLAAVFGGAGVKVIEFVLARLSGTGNGRLLRQELRDELGRLRALNDDCEETLNQTRKELQFARDERGMLAGMLRDKGVDV